ncbi:hypothetical protein MERGE_002637 [Pneumocystis wakefieldiae]|uniref:Uncharacterized protein n=1 Tax=Pneumocystis wakefieldiae TaxID=38082 RepID=A0A899G9S8_9ASCO|nr:hypothetical protein MERGE_002637 [Pneumocystis wakefieldiae]
MHRFFPRSKRTILGLNPDIWVNTQRKINTSKDITEHLDMYISSEDCSLCSEKNRVVKISDDTLKNLCKWALLSFPKGEKKEKLIQKISANIDLVKSIEDVDVKYVRRLVSVRKDGPVLLTHEDLSDETEEPCEWDALGLTKNKEGHFFVLKK